MLIKILIIYASWLKRINMVFHSALIVFLPFWQPESLSWGRVPLIPHQSFQERHVSVVPFALDSLLLSD